MVTIKRKTLHEYERKHPDAYKAILEWAKKTETADWKDFITIKDTFHSIDYAGDNRFIFNIKGNRYRLIALIFFSVRTVYIRWFGTHAEYNKIDVSII